MRKIIIIISILGVLVSCASKKSHCDAYSSIDNKSTAI